MSQQINLVLPELRPRFDWLALPVVASAAGAALLLVVVLFVYASWRVDALAGRDASVKAALQTLQQQTSELGVALGARKGDATLPERIEAMRLSVSQREEALAALGHGRKDEFGAYSETLKGFSRQITEGVWLTGFSLAGKDVEIQGRLTDPAVLPLYIRRLNTDGAFSGKRFEALEMKAGGGGRAALVDKLLTAASDKPASVEPPYTEFVLRSQLLSKGKAP